MASNRSYRDRQYGDSRQSAPYNHRNQESDRFYDDKDDGPSSHSASPNRHYTSSRRRSSPHDAHSSPPRGPAASYRNRMHGDRGRFDRDGNQPYKSRDHRSPSPRGRRQYRDRDHENYRSPSYESRTRSHSGESREGRSKRYIGAPQKELMMEALPADMTEEDITRELQQHFQVEGLTGVRVIRDKHTRQSRQFGFIRFSSVSHAQNFMDHYRPTLHLYGSSESKRDEAAKVRIVYSRERDAKDEDSEWDCPVCNVNNYSTRSRCFRCQAFRTDGIQRGQPQEKPPNIGDNDASPDNTPSQFLLFRGLEPSISDELFAKGVAKLYKSTGDGNQIPSKKGAKVASTTGDANLGAKPGSLRRVLLVKDRRTSNGWRFGFAEFTAVEDAMAALTRFNSFEKFTISSKPVLVSYVHSGVFIPAPVNVDPRFTFQPLANPSIAICYWDQEAYVSDLMVNSDQADAKADDLPSAAPVDTKETKTKKRKAEPTAMDITTSKKATPSYLQRWSNQHAELHGLEPKPITTSTSEPPSQPTPEPPPPPTQSYADPTRLCCYLCTRQFKTGAEVNRHERLSNLHRANLESPELVAKARAKLTKHDLPMHPQIEYRDRARERRRAFGVVNKKGVQVHPGNSKASDKKSGAAEDDAHDGPPAISKGAALLGKMGYVHGSGKGLGATGSGMAKPISQDVYAAGVGLGMEGGKLGDAVEEAGRNTKGGYEGFVERAKDGARERFGRMS